MNDETLFMTFVGIFGFVMIIASGFGLAYSPPAKKPFVNEDGYLVDPDDNFWTKCFWALIILAFLCFVILTPGSGHRLVSPWG